MNASDYRSATTAPRLVVAGCGRDIGASVASVRAFVSALRAQLPCCRVLIFEDGSVDDSRVQLLAWAAEDAEVELILGDTPTGAEPDDARTHRNRRLARCRNRCLDALGSARYADVEFVAVVDLDFFDYLACVAPLVKALRDHAHEFDVLTANALGYPGPSQKWTWGRRRRAQFEYRDARALRHDGFDPTRHAAGERVTYDASHRVLRCGDDGHVILADEERYRTGVGSAFGGLAVYRRQTLLQFRYDEATTECEHVTLHRAMSAAGFDRIRVNLDLVIFGTGEAQRAYLDFLEARRTGINARTRTPPVIVNVTTSPGALWRVHLTLASLLGQTYRPDRLILWLAAERWGGELPRLPRRLERLRARGLEVRPCPPEQRFDELMPMREIAHSAVNVVADDSRVYPRHWLGMLRRSPGQARPRRFKNGPFLPPGDEVWRQIRTSLESASPPPQDHKARGSAGIVTGAGTAIQLVNACLMVRRLRHLGCRLPVELYHTASETVPASVRRAFPADTRFVQITQPGVRHYGIKPWSLWATPFEKCLWIDADNLPLRDPTFLLDTNAPAMVWPDLFRWNHPSVYQAFPELPSSEPEFETGQLVMNSIETAPALWRAVLLNREFSDWIYIHMLGDKDTFRLALKLSGIDYRWADIEVAWAGWRQNNAWRRWKSVGFVQHCPAGAPLFLHRAAGEWDPFRPPGRVGLLSPRSPPYPRGHSRQQPDRVALPPAEVLEADAWAFAQLPELLFFLDEVPAGGLADRLRIKWALLRQRRGQRPATSAPALVNDGPSPEGRLQLADALRESGNFEKAAAIYTEICDRHDAPSEAIEGLALCKEALKEWRDASALWQSALFGFGPSLGRLEGVLRSSFRDDGIRALEAANDISSTAIASRGVPPTLAAFAALFANQRASALEHLRHAFGIESEKELWSSLGALLENCLDKRRHDEIRDVIRFVMEGLDPGPQFFRGVGRALKSMQDWHMLHDVGAAVAHRFPEHALGSVLQASALISQYRFEEANALILAAETRFPDESALHDLRRHIWRSAWDALHKSIGPVSVASSPFSAVNAHAMSLMALQRWDDAEGFLREALDRRGRHGWFLNHLAGICQRKARHREAAALWSESTERFASNVDAWCGLVSSFMDAGDLAEAKRHWKRANVVHPRCNAVQALGAALFGDERAPAMEKQAEAARPHPEKRATWLHAGDAGDVIYALAAIQAGGGGRLYLGVSHVTREPMSAGKIEFLRPLLEAQRYITGVEAWEGQPVDRDFTAFRRAEHVRTNLAQVQWRYALPEVCVDLESSWIETRGAPQHGRPVFARSLRYHDPAWQAIWATLKASAPDAIFVGTDEEYEAFGHGEHVRVRDALEVASTIAGASLFVGNQSLPYAIAEGLKIKRTLEVCPQTPNCIFPGATALADALRAFALRNTSSVERTSRSA